MSNIIDQPVKSSTLVKLKRLLILAIYIAVGFLVYDFTISRIGSSKQSTAFGIILFWLFTAYFTLPRLHRFLTKIYLPDYFIGRVRTGDGLLGDPVNLALLGTEKQLHEAFRSAEWTKADELTLDSTVKMIRASIFHKSYPTAPVSSLYLFGRKQDFAYQHEVDGNPHKRHHVRFWKVPEGWKLPGGFEADWLAAGTYDRKVGFSVFTLQITHKIDENTDEERDYIIQTLKEVNKIKRLTIIDDYSSGYHHRNGGGDAIKTDGAMPFIFLK